MMMREALVGSFVLIALFCHPGHFPNAVRSYVRSFADWMMIDGRLSSIIYNRIRVLLYTYVRKISIHTISSFPWRSLLLLVPTSILAQIAENVPKTDDNDKKCFSAQSTQTRFLQSRNCCSSRGEGERPQNQLIAILHSRRRMEGASRQKPCNNRVCDSCKERKKLWKHTVRSTCVVCTQHAVICIQV